MNKPGKIKLSISAVALFFFMTAVDVRALLPDDFGDSMAREIIEQREWQQSKFDPDLFQARLETEREKKNEELRAQMQLPPVGFAHFENPPSPKVRTLQAEREQRDRKAAAGEKRIIDFVGSSVIAGILLLGILLYHVNVTRRQA